MSESNLFQRIEKCVEYRSGGLAYVDEGEMKEICSFYEQRIADLERTNLLLAEQLKKCEGVWLAPVEADEFMCLAGAQAPRPSEKHSIMREAYKAMRDNWLSRNK